MIVRLAFQLVFLGVTIVAGWKLGPIAAHWRFFTMTGRLALLAETAFIAGWVHAYAWLRRELPMLVTMPLEPRAMFRLALREVLAPFVTMVIFTSCFAVAMATGIETSLAPFVFFSLLINICGAAIAILLVLIPRGTVVVELLALTIGGAIFVSDKQKLVRLLAALDPHIAQATAVLLLVIGAAIAAAAAYRLVPRRYSAAAIIARLRSNAVLLPDAIDDTPDDAVSRTLRERLSARTYALLMLLTRESSPEDLRPKVRWSVWMTVAVLAIAWTIRLSWQTDAGFFLVVAALFLLCMVALSHAPHAGVRRDWRHPLIETLPVSTREYAFLMLIVDAMLSAALLVLAFIAELASPIDVPWFVYAIVAALMTLAVSVMPMMQAAIYQVDPRRTFWARFFQRTRGVVISLGGIAAIGTIVSYGIQFDLRLVFIVPPVFVIGSIVLSWFLTLRMHEEHRFDAEYDPRIQSSARW